MIKKYFAGAFALLLIAAILLGCGPSDGKSVGEPEELTGVFAGPAGYLSFYPDKEILVSLSDDYIWLLEGKENDQTYGYVFIHGNEEISYDKAEAIYLHDGKDTFARIICLASKDKIVLLPGNENEAVFERRTD
ncbi:MAG: hypothetical protein ACOX3D_06385 [Syntrophomonadales bacterium]|jgi:hypothetical protein